jgi:tetratricopeptide repeat protein
MILAGGAVLLAGLGIYLYFEVRKAPAQPLPAEKSHKPEPVAAADKPAAPALPDKPADTPAPPPPPPTPRPVRDDGEHVPGPRIPTIGAPLSNARANPKLEALMDEANKAYDRGEFDEAKSLATKALAKVPANSRMLRILVSAACQEGDSNEAQKHYNQLPASDRAQMKVRCERYGVTFTEPPAQ